MPTLADCAISVSALVTPPRVGSRKNVNVVTGGQDCHDQAIERRRVAGDLRLKLQPFAHRHDGDAMHRNRSADDHFVAGLRASRMNVHAFWHDADALRC